MTDDPNIDDRAAPPRLGQIADVFIRYGNFTLGGGSATTAVMHGQLVTKRRWLSDERRSRSASRSVV
jgi:chromate transport protein ChrA